VAEQLGAEDWNAVVRTELFEPLGMKDSSLTAEAIEAAANHASGHRWTPEGTVEVPFTPSFPYEFGGAGAINSNVDDMAHWLRLHLGNGDFEGKRLVSAENLDFTRTPKIGVSPTISYAMGWAIRATPNGRIIWHSGSTDAFGAFAGFLPEQDVGVVVLTNESNFGLPDAIGEWLFDRIMDNPAVDNVAMRLDAAMARFETAEKLFAKPVNPRSSPALASLAGDFANPIFGRASVEEEGGAVTVAFEATGAKLKLSPWDGEIFTVSLVPEGRFAAMAANFGPKPLGFVQFQMDLTGKFDQFTFTVEDGQAYLFERE
jgi:CubicO group peptidase (beta-lactamase class C family)